MTDLKDPKWMWLKAWLFVAIGCIASALVLLAAPQWQVAIYLGLAIWAFCRAYYFAFYVLERYIDPGYRFAGLWSLVRHVRRRRR